jgi:hypothetical protein
MFAAIIRCTVVNWRIRRARGSTEVPTEPSRGPIAGFHAGVQPPNVRGVRRLPDTGTRRAKRGTVLPGARWIIPMVHEAKVNRQRTRSRHDRKSRGSRGNSVGRQPHPRGRLDAPFGVGGCVGKSLRLHMRKSCSLSSSREPTFRWFQNIVEGQKFHRDDRQGAARGSCATRATRATRRDAN